MAEVPSPEELKTALERVVKRGAGARELSMYQDESRDLVKLFCLRENCQGTDYSRCALLTEKAIGEFLEAKFGPEDVHFFRIVLGLDATDGKAPSATARWDLAGRERYRLVGNQQRRKPWKNNHLLRLSFALYRWLKDG